MPMTNKEIYSLVQKLDEKADRDRERAIKDRKEMMKELHALKIELSIFKGRSIGFLTAISLIFTLLTNVGLTYITKGK